MRRNLNLVARNFCEMRYRFCAVAMPFFNFTVPAVAFMSGIRNNEVEA